MTKITRVLATGGLGLLAALTMGAGPAQATNTHTVAQATPSPQYIQLTEGVQVAGFYSTLQACDLAGRFGQRNGYWDRHGCTPVRVGVRSGAWALQVISYDNWDRRGFDVALRAVCAFPTQVRPYWVGQYGPGRPARVFQRHPGRKIQGHPGRVSFDHPGRIGFDHPGRHGYDQRGRFNFDQRGRGGFEERGPAGRSATSFGVPSRTGMGSNPRADQPRTDRPSSTTHHAPHAGRPGR